MTQIALISQARIALIVAIWSWIALIRTNRRYSRDRGEKFLALHGQTLGAEAMGYESRQIHQD
jgi:hypothetical protein